MRNIAVYPVTAAEAAEVAADLARDLLKDTDVVGDVRPYALRMTAQFLLARQEDFDKWVAERTDLESTPVGSGSSPAPTSG